MILIVSLIISTLIDFLLKSKTLPLKIFFSPINSAVNLFFGLLYISLGVPCSSNSPFAIIAILSATDIASSWLWVTCTKVMPTVFWRRLSSIHISFLNCASKADKGSSRSKTSFSSISALANWTLCCWPPDSSLGILSERPERPTKFIILLTFSSIISLEIDLILSPYPIFWETFIWGNKAKPWKTIEVGLLSGGRSSTFFPLIATEPLSGLINPPIDLNKVVFPPPLGPNNTKYSPWAISRSTFFNA